MPESTKDFSRRDFLKLSSGAAASLVVAGLIGCSPSRATTSAPIGVQLYSVRHELEEDFRGTLATLALMGFEGVEFADYYGRSSKELKATLDSHGLACCGSHIYFSDLQGESFDETVAFNQTLGNDFLIIRWIDEEDRDSRDTLLQTIDEYNEVSERLEPYGMRLGYHSHDYIFETFEDGDELLWDIIAENTHERFVMQLDTGYVGSAGLDPVELIQRHPGRTTSMHAKPYSATDEEAVIGEDDLDWPNIIEAAENDGGIEWHILEYEIESVPPLEALEACIENYRAMLA